MEARAHGGMSIRGTRPRRTRGDAGAEGAKRRGAGGAPPINPNFCGLIRPADAKPSADARTCDAESLAADGYLAYELAAARVAKQQGIGEGNHLP